MASTKMAASLPPIDFLKPSSCQSACTARRASLASDIEALHLSRDQLLQTQKQLVTHGLCLMKNHVKKMTVKEFNASFGCDVIEIVRGKLADVEGGESKKRRVEGTNNGLSLKTPAAVRFAGKPPMTRTVRKGEKVVSINGSPVDQFDQGELVITAKKRLRPTTTAASQAPFPISIGIGAGNGETIDLSDPNQRKLLDGEQKAQAKEQIVAMQEQMKKLMASWN